MSTCAIHIISTTYGTWLPGNDRGHWSPLYDLYGQLLRAGHQLNMPDETTHVLAQKRLLEPPKILEPHERFLVAATLANHFTFPNLPSQNQSYIVPANAPPGQGQGYMKPRCLAAAIEDSHFHLLLSPLEEDLDRFVGRLKGSASSELKKLPANRTRTHHWTAGFWRVFLFNSNAIPPIRQYIINHNLRRNLPPDPYPWITPPTQ